ncbi:MAG: hypothetical protein HIU92_05895 [Proteobacteria bacterium]|nr:hypothetical protein [Pseudomonadota bacterium]
MQAKSGRPNILRGIVLLSTGRPAGLAEMGSGPQEFLASLAPLVAFPLVGCLLMLAQGKVLDAVTDFLATLVAILAPPVLSYSLARLWGRQERWFRFGTAFNWCQWVLPLLGALLVLIAGFMVQAGVPLRPVVVLLCCVLLAYAFWLHWFLARHGLDLSRGRAALLVFLVNLITIILVGAPQLLQLALQSIAAGKG